MSGDVRSATVVRSGLAAGLLTLLLSGVLLLGVAEPAAASGRSGVFETSSAQATPAPEERTAQPTPEESEVGNTDDTAPENGALMAMLVVLTGAGLLGGGVVVIMMAGWERRRRDRAVAAGAGADAEDDDAS